MDKAEKPTEMPPFDEFENEMAQVKKEVEASVGVDPKDLKPPETTVNLPPARKERTPVLIKGGQLQVLSDEQMWGVATKLLKGRAVPKWFTTAEQVFASMVFLMRLGVPAETNLNCVANVEGTLSIFGDLPLDLAISSKELEFHDEYLFDKDYKKICFENKNVDDPYLGAVVLLKRKGQEQKSFTFTVEDAKKAGLWEMRSNSGSAMPWAKYPKIMLIRRARAWGLKTVFPDTLKGAKITEYDFNQAPDLRDVTHSQETPSTGNYISDKYGKEPIVQSVAPRLPTGEPQNLPSGELPFTESNTSEVLP